MVKFSIPVSSAAAMISRRKAYDAAFRYRHIIPSSDGVYTGMGILNQFSPGSASSQVAEVDIIPSSLVSSTTDVVSAQLNLLAEADPFSMAIGHSVAFDDGGLVNAFHQACSPSAEGMISSLIRDDRYDFDAMREPYMQGEIFTKYPRVYADSFMAGGQIVPRNTPYETPQAGAGVEICLAKPGFGKTTYARECAGYYDPKFTGRCSRGDDGFIMTTTSGRGSTQPCPRLECWEPGPLSMTDWSSICFALDVVLNAALHEMFQESFLSLEPLRVALPGAHSQSIFSRLHLKRYGYETASGMKCIDIVLDSITAPAVMQLMPHTALTTGAVDIAFFILFLLGFNNAYQRISLMHGVRVRLIAILNLLSGDYEHLIRHVIPWDDEKVKTLILGGNQTPPHPSTIAPMVTTFNVLNATAAAITFLGLSNQANGIDRYMLRMVRGINSRRFSTYVTAYRRS